MLKEHIGWNIKVYVDDLLVKNRTPEQHLANLHKAFAVLRCYQMKLNPAKCAFGVKFGKFLGFMVSERGIRPTWKRWRPYSTWPHLEASMTYKDSSAEWRPSIDLYPKSTDNCLPFFKVPRKAQTWNGECDRAFENLK